MIIELNRHEDLSQKDACFGNCVIYLFCKGRAWVGKGSNKTPTCIFYFIFLRGLCHYSLRALKFP